MSAARTLYIIGSAAPPVRQLDEACKLVIDRGWRPYVILTPVAATWVDVHALAAVTGNPVRVHPRLPDEQDPLPNADAVLAAPLTFNTINKWAAGISDTLALGLLNELLVGGPPIVAAPCAKRALSAHPSYGQSLNMLTSADVTVVDQDSVVERGPDGLARFRWSRVLRTLDHIVVQIHADGT
jgi:phosphopantothenoylcysteine synthetase/decarboxylase